MRERFHDVWTRIGAQGDADVAFDRLDSLYSEPHRFYHTMVHVADCLSELDTAVHMVQQPDLLEFAIWYHDAVYDTRAKDNEERSARLAYEVSQAAQLPEDFALGAQGLIRATRHDAVPQSIDARVLVDIDLAILGRSPEEFDAYEANIRREYAWVPDERFREARSGILEAFLEGDSIYLTDVFEKKYGDQARANLLRSMDALRS